MAITGAVGVALRQEAPFQAEIQMGAQLIMDFQGARSGRRPYYWYRGTRYTRPEKIPGWSFTRASAGYAEDSAGNLIAFPANEPRITDRGLLIEEARTNYVWNSVMAGAVAGSPGAAPTYWVTSGSSPASVGLTQTIATGVENGLAYLEVTLSGTPTATGGTGYYFTGVTDNVLVSTGQTWTASAYARLVGVPSGVTSVTLGIVERDAGGASTGNSTTAMALGSTMARFVHTRTMTGATTVKAQASASVNFTSGVPLNVTYRIYAPQMEQGAFATSPILTATGVATRAADSASITGLGTLLGQFRTNHLPNSTWQGGAVGVLPTGMAYSARGLTVAPSSFGMDADGFPYMDLRISGTVTSAGNLDIQNTVATGAPSAVIGQTWNTSALIGQVAGTAPPLGATWSVWEANSTGSWLSSSGATVSTSGPARLQTSKTFSSATVAKAMAALQLAGLTVGQVVDVTYRISQPQLETTTLRTEFIPTATGSVTVGSPFSVAAWADLPAIDGVARTLVTLDDGSVSNRVRFSRNASNQGQFAATVSGGGQTSLTANGYAGALLLKMASRVKDASYSGTVNGATLSTAIIAPPGLNRLRLGVDADGASNFLHGYLARIVLGDVDDSQVARLAA